MLGKVDGWFSYTTALCAGQLLYNWISSSSNTIFSDKTTEVFSSVMNPIALNESKLPFTETHIVQDVVSGAASKVYSAASGVFWFGWDQLSWTSKIVGALGIAYLVNQCRKDRDAKVVNNIEIHVHGGVATQRTVNNRTIIELSPEKKSLRSVVQQVIEQHRKEKLKAAG
ncbi:MAG: hypothetical protein COT85_06735 [Chlamydiae bacterium CG10_big_fil_rev_8_21_14_0_10_42_34]|nr:MAG: hypothetical protein COT85_06735 [Chlamydiae bacterium CG10_big_fil_rev_8_21_14_0_10_42_34]